MSLALALTACEKKTTHEPGTPSYDQIIESGNATYTIHGGFGYENSANVATAEYTGSASPPTSHAYGSFGLNGAETDQGTAAAAFLFPAGTFTGSSPRQEGAIDIMRWDSQAGNYGAIRIGSDHKARLVRGDSTNVQSIGDPFTLQEGCWNWLAVTQKLSTSSNAINELYLNGRKLVDSHAPNKYSATAVPNAIRFGMTHIDTGTGTNQQNDTTLKFHVDNAYFSTTGGVPSPWQGATACSPPDPNILFIVTDDQRYDTMWQMPKTMKWFFDGGEAADADVIAGGTRFTEGFVTTPLCCPSRSSILSGKFAHNHGVRRNEEGDAIETVPETQLQSYLRSQGYQTGIVGKYLNFWPTYKAPPNFDKYWLCPGGLSCIVNDNGTMKEVGTGSSSQVSPYVTSWIRDKAIEFINYTENDDSKPWFLYLTPTAPHEQGSYPYEKMDDPDPQSRWGKSYLPPGPALGPPTYPSRNEGAGGTNPITDKPEWVQNTNDPLSSPQTIFYRDDTETTGGPLRDQMLRALGSVDEMVDEVFNRLDTAGEERDTLAIFIGDNGYMWREHGRASRDALGPENVCTSTPPGASGCGLTGKSKPYTESIKVPFFMRWPANTNVSKGVNDGQRYAANVDLAPTALRVVGLNNVADQLDGRSLLDNSDSRKEILTEGYGSLPNSTSTVVGTWASLRGQRDGSVPDNTRHYQYIEYYEDDGVTPRSGAINREYYDLKNDPYELENLLADGNPDTPDPVFINELSQRLLRARLCKDTGCRASDPPAANDTDAPRVWIKNPSDGGVVGYHLNPTDGSVADGHVYFDADASDNIGVKSVALYRDSETVPLRTVFRRPYAADVNTASLSTGVHRLRAIAKDYVGNQRTAEITIRVERYDVQATGATGTAGTISNGEVVTYYFDRPIQPGAFVTGWDGTQRTVNALIEPDVPTQDYNDALTVEGVPALGIVNLGRSDYAGFRLTPVVNASFPQSKMEMDASRQWLKITLGGRAGSVGNAAEGGTMIWTPGKLTDNTDVCPVTPTCRVHESVTAPVPPAVVTRPDEEF